MCLLSIRRSTRPLPGLFRRSLRICLAFRDSSVIHKRCRENTGKTAIKRSLWNRREHVPRKQHDASRTNEREGDSELSTEELLLQRPGNDTCRDSVSRSHRRFTQRICLGFSIGLLYFGQTHRVDFREHRRRPLVWSKKWPRPGCVTKQLETTYSHPVGSR